MKQQYILIPLTLLILSCGSDEVSTTDIPVPASSGSSTPVIPATSTTAPVNTITPGEKTPSTTNSVVTPTSANTALNPAHGQPGHRCDIQVGAPLNSAPTQQTQPTATISQPVMSVDKSSKVSVSPSGLAPTGNGLNPEHGKPGHRCDLAVGAPLDTKPKQ